GHLRRVALWGRPDEQGATFVAQVYDSPCADWEIVTAEELAVEVQAVETVHARGGDGGVGVGPRRRHVEVGRPGGNQVLPVFGRGAYRACALGSDRHRYLAARGCR